MNEFTAFRDYMERNFFYGAKNPLPDKDFFNHLYTMDQEACDILIFLNLLY